MATRREIVGELRAGGCTPDEIALFLLVEQTFRRRERARRAERLLRTLGAALARFATRLITWPAEVLLPGR